jgi:hypothetical protein
MRWLTNIQSDPRKYILVEKGLGFLNTADWLAGSFWKGSVNLPFPNSWFSQHCLNKTRINKTRIRLVIVAGLWIGQGRGSIGKPVVCNTSLIDLFFSQQELRILLLSLTGTEEVIGGDCGALRPLYNL